MSSKSLSISRSLECVTDRWVLRDACRKLATLLAQKLERDALVYRKLSLRVDTEDGTVGESRRFSRCCAPSSMSFHIDSMVSRLCPSSPVERVTIAVSELAGAPFEQEALFGEGDPLKEEKLRRVLGEPNLKYRLAFASSLKGDRRERMLSFYDPLRREGRIAGDEG